MNYIELEDMERWRELAVHIRQRRDQMGLKRNEIMDRGGPGTTRLHDLENAKRTSYRRSLLNSLENVFEWPTGTIEHFLKTGVLEDIDETASEQSRVSLFEIQKQLANLNLRVSALEEWRSR